MRTSYNSISSARRLSSWLMVALGLAAYVGYAPSIPADSSNRRSGAGSGGSARRRERAALEWEWSWRFIGALLFHGAEERFFDYASRPGDLRNDLPKEKSLGTLRSE